MSANESGNGAHTKNRRACHTLNILPMHSLSNHFII